MQMNNIKSSKQLRTGSYLIIPIPADRALTVKEQAPEQTVSKKKVAAAKPQPSQKNAPEAKGPAKEIRYVVKEGDTLWDIALMYDLSVADIKRWNNLRGNVIRPRDELLLRIDKKRV